MLLNALFDYIVYEAQIVLTKIAIFEFQRFRIEPLVMARNVICNLWKNNYFCNKAEHLMSLAYIYLDLKQLRNINLISYFISMGISLPK